MAAAKNYGPKRLVVGAHYGLGDFLAQRITAILLVVYTLVLFFGVLFMPAFDYESWRAIFAFHVFVLPLGQILATLAFASLAYHAWIGVRDIWMDYIHSVGLRLTLHVLTILWLVGSLAYFVQIVWRL